MRLVVLLLAAVAVASCEQDDGSEEPWVEEEDVEEPYNDEYDYDRRKRDVRYQYDEDRRYEGHRSRRDTYDIPIDYSEHIRVKRRCEDEPHRNKRSAEHSRVPRQVHQYEVHEFTDESEPSSVPYEAMLAASAEHHQRVYVAPPPGASQYLSPDVSAPLRVFHPTTFVSPIVSQPLTELASVNVKANTFAPSNLAKEQPQESSFVPIAGPVPEPIKKLAEDDQYVAAAGHHHKHSRGGGNGGGHAHHGHHHGSHGGKSHKGSRSNHYLDKGNKGFRTDEHHRKEYEEAEGKKKKHHDAAGHKGHHEEEAHGSRGAHFDEKKGHKKGHKTKGYHNKYHKDEFHKEHKFYDDFHKSGEHHRYGKFNAKHASNESGKKKAHHVNAGHDIMEKGKKGYSNKGHVDADHRGYKGKHGHDDHHEHHEHYGKKGGKQDGKHWEYKN